MSTAQHPIGSGFGARSTADDVLAGHDLTGHRALVITGVITNNSVEATARMAGNLGFEAYVVSDATFTFGKTDWEGRPRTAEEVHAMSLANLHGDAAHSVCGWGRAA